MAASEGVSEVSRVVTCGATVTELEEAGGALAERCSVGDVLLLKGDVGLGKTCFGEAIRDCE